VSKYDLVWSFAGVPEVREGKELVFKMERAFDVKDERKWFEKVPERDFYLHTRTNWRVGFFD